MALKAWVLHGIDSLTYEDLEEPELLETEVLVEVKAAGICGSDIPRIYRDGAHRMPIIPGHEFSGSVIRAGGKADEKWIGKRVGIFPLIPCKKCRSCLSGKYEMCRQYSYLGSRRDGGFSEYVAVPEWNLIELPEKVSFEQAAMLEPLAVAVHAMHRVELAQADRVAVAGLGTIGLFLTMLLAAQGIKEIFVIGNKEFQKKMALRLGIPEDHYCDSRTEDVRDFVMLHTEGYGVDVFFECVGRQETISQVVELTAPAGRICMVGNPYSDITLDRDVYWKILRHQLKVMGTWNSSYSGDGCKECDTDDWRTVLKLLEQEKIRPEELVTQRFAMRELEQGFRIMRDKTEDYVKIMMVCE